VTGPGGFSRAITSSQRLQNLTPGSYSVSAVNVAAAGHGWSPSPAAQDLSIASNGDAEAAVQYAVATGALTVTVNGLPAGTAAALRLNGPGGFSQAIDGTTTLTGLTPGVYALAGSMVANGTAQYLPGIPAIPAIAPGISPALVTVTYTRQTGSIAVTVSGLPPGALASLSLTGPGGFTAAPTAAGMLKDLDPGTYTLIAMPVQNGGTTWTPGNASLALTVNAGATATADVAYSSPANGGGSLNLRIDGMYVTQAAQRYDGSVPLVAGRDGYLRVFVLADNANSAQPQVRVRLYSHGSLVRTFTIQAPGAGVPQSVNEGNLSASWNVLIPAALVQPDLTILADVDPGDTIAETSETDNAFPTSGTPGPIDVRTLPTFNVRFVPVLQSVNLLQGDVTVASVPSFLSSLRTLLPVADYSADVRAPYTTSAPPLVSDNANGAWGTVLSEILALKSGDASARYYYGVVRTTYSSGVAGIGYVGGSAHTAIGWDRLPSASGVMAHEVGHNMGRSHAPCGGAGGPDATYPHSGGSIGIWGLDVAARELKNPATYYDLMGYCDPDWVSDYNWSAMVTLREGGPDNSVGQSDRLTVGRGLLVWGRITPSGLVLEPAFFVDNADLAPPPAGPHRIEARDANGAVMFSIAFAANEANDLPAGREEAFAFVVPAGRALSADIAELRLVSGARAVARRPSPAAPPAAVFSRGADGRGLLQWNAAAHPVVMVRDAATGQVLSFARGGSVRLPAGAARLDATFSDGTRSARVLLTRQ
jgi:hypothetical protein